MHDEKPWMVGETIARGMPSCSIAVPTVRVVLSAMFTSRTYFFSVATPSDVDGSG